MEEEDDYDGFFYFFWIFESKISFSDFFKILKIMMILELR